MAQVRVQLGDKMQRLVLSAVVLMLTGLFATGALAAKALTSKAQLETGATHIIVGKVRSISVSKNVEPEWVTTAYAAEIVIDKIEKGEGLKVGDVVHARYLTRGWRGIGTPPPYDAGHSPKPNNNDSVRVYLVNQGYNGAGYTMDGGYDVYYKNGFEILPTATPSR